MLQITAKHNIFIGINPIDFRKGIDGLMGYCKSFLQLDPYSGNVFLFINKNNKAIKILFYDSQGFWLCTKRISQGKFCWWPNSRQQVAEITIPQLNSVLWNDQPKVSTQGWRSLS